MKAFIFKLILTLSKVFSLKLNRAIARLFGKLIWILSKKIKHITLSNIEKCYPALSEIKKTELAKQSINSAVMNLMELGTIWDKNLIVEDIVKNSYGIEKFERALKQGKGLLLCAPHMGNWEALNLVLARFEKYAVLYKPPGDKNIEKILLDFRGSFNALQIEANLKGVRKIMKHLKDKGFIGILPDQRPKGGQGVFAPFYGVPTYTMTLFSKLAAKTKVPVFFIYALRTESGFDVHFEESADDIYKDLETSVAYMNSTIQKIVDEAPEQYQWTYKRFSIQPEGEPPFY